MSQILEYFPEIIAQLSFVTSGIAIGYLFYIQVLTLSASHLENVVFWPYLVGILVTFVLCGIGLLLLKHYKKREIFVHFYFLLIGQIILLTSGCLFFNDNVFQPSPIALYLVAIGHALIYVPGLSYVNLRVKKHRTTRISICHCFYFIGFLLAVIELGMALKHMENFGLYIIIGSSVLICLIITNEIFHLFNICNYKKSLDHEINQANNNNELLLNRKEFIESDKRFAISNGWSIFVGKNYQNSIQFWLPLIKLKGSMLFSYVLLVGYCLPATIIFMDNNTDTIMLPQCFIVVGAIIGTVLTRMLNGKWLFSIINLMQIIILLISIVIYHIHDQIDTISLWLYFGLSGISYCLSDIFILEITNLKYTEFMLSIGYLIEMIPIAIFQYFTIYKPADIWYWNDNFYNFVAHSLAFIITTIILIIILVSILPTTKNKTLLQIRLELFNIRYFQQNNNNNNNNNRAIQQFIYHQPIPIQNQQQFMYQASAPSSGGNYYYEPNQNFNIYTPTYQLPRVHLT